MSSILYKELSDRIIGLAITVHKAMGPGFLERVYEECMCVEFAYNQISFTRQKVWPLLYRGSCVESYISDLFVENKIILELKSVDRLNKNMEAQLLNYLHASHIRLGYLINFRNTILEFRRMIL